MDINDISINALVRDAGLCTDFEWCNNSTFACKLCGLELEVNMERDIESIEVRDPETVTKIKFRHVLPRQFAVFIDSLRWDFEEEEAA